jgi:hypothetical protein
MMEISSVTRIEGLDVNRRRVAVLIGETDDGRVVVGMAPAGADRADFVLLNADSGVKLLRAVRAAVRGAAGRS